MLTFNKGEEVLSNWLKDNAFVTWVVDDDPWNHEKKIINELNPRLNIKHNNHPFANQLSSIRTTAKAAARRA
jgi:hypothetical protein